MAGFKKTQKEMKQITQKAKRAHHRLVSLPTVLIVVMIILSGWLSIYLLRHNNLRMSELRQEVHDADAIGDRAEITQKLRNLQRYVARHMNTKSKVELRSSYQRDSQAAQQSAAQQLGHVELYNRALAECSTSDTRGTALAECINEKLSGESGGIVDLPDPRLYRYSFDSPPFSFDVAGFALLTFAMFVYAGLHQLAVVLLRLLQNRSKRQ